MISKIVVSGRVSRAAGLAIAAVSAWFLLAGSQAARAGEVVTGFQTVTTYTGTYVFDYQLQQNYINGILGPAQRETREHDVYRWTEIDRELIVPTAPQRFSDTYYRDVVAGGSRTWSTRDTGPGTSGSATCHISDDGKGEQLVNQREFTGKPVINPLTSVSWRLPDDVQPPNGRIHESGTATPAGDTNICAGWFLGSTLYAPCNTCVFLSFTTGNAADYARAWSGDQTVHLNTLVHGFSKHVHGELSGYQTSGASGQVISRLEQGFTRIDGHVTSKFTQIRMRVFKRLPPPPPPNCTKAEALVDADQAIDMLSGLDQPEPPKSGDRVLLPPPTCAGTVKIDVSGNVLPRAHELVRGPVGSATAGSSASHMALLASTGTIHTRASWAPRTVRLRLTSEGRRLLAGSHPGLTVAVRVRIAPSHGRAATLTRRYNVAAT